jgi:hypothetical protein
MLGSPVQGLRHYRKAKVSLHHTFIHFSLVVVMAAARELLAVVVVVVDHPRTTVSDTALTIPS